LIPSVDVYKQHIYDKVGELGYTIPPSCPLSAENDVLRVFEENKKEVIATQTKCCQHCAPGRATNFF